MRLIVCLAFVVTCVAVSTQAEVVELVNGDRLNVTVVDRTEEHVTFVHPVLGEVTVPTAQVAAIHDAPPEAAPAAEAEEKDPQVTPVPVAAPAEKPAEAKLPQDPKVFGIPLLPGWDRKIELGIDGTEGNSDTFNFRAAFMADFEDEEDRWHLGSAFVRQTSDGDKTRNDFYAEAIKDWLIPGEKHFYFAQVRYDYDDFEAWRHRVSGAGGVGYQFIKSDDFDLIGRVGGGGNYAWGGDGDDEFTPEALLGIEGTWRIDDNQTFEFKNTLYPSLGDLGEFRNLTSLAYVIKMDRAKGLSLKLGLENEYESETDDDSKHNDLKYFAALVFEF